MFRDTGAKPLAAPSQSAELLNENQVAQRLGVSIATVRRWRSQKTGPRFRKIGAASVRYSIDDLAAWIESQPAGGETGVP
jgi:predicted DNA-binding transcriptional regulator AlpA